MPKRFRSANTAYNESSKTVNPADMPASRLYIPKVGIYATITAEGMTTGKGRTFADIPPQSWRAGWENWSAPMDAAHGSSVVNGHDGLPGGPDMVFTNLHKLSGHRGATAYTTDAHGGLHGWRLQSTHLYRKGHLPNVYKSGQRYLVLNTCDGKITKMTTVNGGKKMLHAQNFQAVFVPAPVRK